ncbi:MAG TPA: GDP-mannose 4,6-dehydratase, partial [Nitrosopumilaceae archaeon]|nr:GDP-mannose 4,6-dehydratase [Nitrosopumilaceae archaeon]
FGPRQSARAIIPTIISQIASGSREIKLGDISPTRDFSYVKDTCGGFIALAKCDTSIGKEVNIASKTEISIKDTLGLIQEIMKSDVKFITETKRVRPENSEVFRLYGDNSLLHELTGFRPEYNLRKGLELTCKWFENTENLKKYKPEIYNV